MSDERPRNDDAEERSDDLNQASPDADEHHQPELDGLDDEQVNAETVDQPQDSIDESAGSLEKAAGEEFDNVFGDSDNDDDASDDDHDEYDYYDYDDYDGYSEEDYDLDDRDGPSKPRSVAHRVITRERNTDDIEKVSESGADADTDAASEDEEGGMSFLDHLEEFRWTLGRSALAFVVGILVVVYFHKDISVLLQLPLNTAYGSAEVASKNLITYKAMGVIMVLLQIALLGGLTLSMPFMLYFVGSFIAPGLTEKERRILRPACFAAFLLFIMGVLFAFYIILPLALGFTVRLNQHLGFDIFWAASDYYNMVVWFSLGIGAFFQFPLIVVILVFIGVLSTATLKRVRRAVFVGLMVFSALVSPGGDPLSLGVTTGFMYLLYELAIWIGGRLEAKKLAEEEARA